MGVATLALLALGLAGADEPPADPAPGPAPALALPEALPDSVSLAAARTRTALTRPRKKWGGIVIPLVTYNTTDGLAFGVGGELFERDLASDVGFKRKIGFQALVSIDGRYQSHGIVYETRTGRNDVFAEVGFKAWTSLLYAGFGGEDVLVDWGALEEGNRAWTPYATAGITQPLGPGLLYVQGFFRYMEITPAEGGLLAQDAPTGFLGGAYADLTAGWFIDVVDRWPLPVRGWRVEADVRGGGAWLKDVDGFLPSASLHAEVIGWWPLFGPRLVVAGRFVAGHALGDRPFFEDEFIGGRRRVEIGYEKALTGYGRTRTRGDGAVAALVELRPWLFRTKHRFWDLAGYLTVFAEEGFVFDQWYPGPHMPTVGVGAVLLWQGGTLLRPFAAWGWRADEPGGVRRASAQFGLSLQDPL